MLFPVLQQIGRCHPQRDHRQRLVAPGEIAPQHIEIQLGQQGADSQERQGNDQPVPDLFLFQVCNLRQDQPGAAERGIPGGDRTDHHADHSQHATDAFQHRTRDFQHHGGRSRTGERLIQEIRPAVKCHARRGPDQRDYGFGDHRAVEDLSPLPFAGDALGNHRRLRGMEAGDRAAGHRDEHERPYGKAFRMVTPLRDFRDGVAAEDRSAQHAEGHYDQDHAEYRIQLSDQFVDRQQCSQYVIDQDHDNPEGSAQEKRTRFRRELMQQLGNQRSGTGHEHRSAQDQEDHGEDTHDPFRGCSQVDSRQFRNGGAAMSAGDHAAHIVVHRAAEDRSEHDPQEDHRPEAGTHQRTEDRPGSRNVQQLD